MVTLKDVYDLLIDVEGALNYCGDSYERECTETERDDLSAMIQKLKKQLGIEDVVVTNFLTPELLHNPNLPKDLKCPHCTTKIDRIFSHMGMAYHLEAKHNIVFNSKSIEKKIKQLHEAIQQ